MPEAKRDYYEVLGVSREATSREIKSAYRRLAVQYHPDRNPGDAQAEARFKEAAEAYSVLSDNERRQAYDRFGHQGVNGTGFSGFGGMEDIFAAFGDIFGGIFGSGMGGGSRGRRGADLEVVVELEFEEPAEPQEKDVEVRRKEACVHCRGTGARDGTAMETCSTCGGMGQVRQVTRSIFGHMQTVTACPACRGGGKRILEPCPACNGSGFVSAMHRLKVKIPAGVENGNQLRLRGEGQPAQGGGPPGDLFVTLRVRPHERFRRRGGDVLLDLPVTFSQAALGDTIQIPTLDGPVEFGLPAGTQSHEVFRLAGAGFRELRSGRRGDQLVRVVVRTPTRIDEPREQLLRQLAELEGDELKPPRKGLFEKLKETLSDLVD